MPQPSPIRKKLVETHYINEARRASTIFPLGRLEPHERPDFLLYADQEVIGIEVTELCREEPRAEAGRLSKVPEKAKALYGRFSGTQPVDVSIAFWKAEALHFNLLTKSLADFVYSHRALKGKRFERTMLPQGFLHIGIHEPLVNSGRWRAVRAFDSIVAPKEIVERRIAEKNGRIPEYRLSARQVWLLIINDRFLGPGEVYVRSDHVAQWSFSFDFDKVLLFLREPGGTGEVIEISRA